MEREIRDIKDTLPQQVVVASKNGAAQRVSEECAQSCGNCSSCACGSSSCGSCSSCASCGCDGSNK